MQKNTHRGFTLIELSIVIVVISLMLSGIMSILTQKVRMEQRAIMAEKFSRIQAALMDYRIRYNRLPCPANITTLMSNATLGREAANPGSCTGGSPAATFSAVNTAAGGVPVKSLGLPEEYMFDAWGNRFLYVVDIRITASEANAPFKTYNATNTTIGVITITETGGTTITDKGIYAIVSHGANGHGAYTLAGVRKSARSTNAFELINCHCNVSAAATAFGSTFYISPETSTSTGLTTGFDDMLVYGRRNDMVTANENFVEKW